MRIVSLVPSLTETLFALGLDGRQIVGRTSWCVCPEPEVRSVRSVGGTKTPSLRVLRELAPDLILLEREENTLQTFEACQQANLATWVTHVRAVGDVPPLLRSLGVAVERAVEGEALARTCELALKRASAHSGSHPPLVLPLIWHEPLMAVNAERYAGDLLHQVGLRLPSLPCPTGYPTLTVDAIGALGVEVLLLSSEPHDFKMSEGQALAQAVQDAGWPRPRVVHVDGQALTWFGARTASALDWATSLRRQLELRD